MNSTFNPIIFFCIVLIVAIVVLTIYLIRTKCANRKYDEENRRVSGRYNIIVQEAEQKDRVIQQYEEDERQRSAQQAQEQEKQKRRIVTQKIKKTVFDRDNKTCQICGISWSFLEDLCEGLGDYLLLETDHIVSVQQGGTGADINNLQCLCWRCNRSKGGKRSNEETRLRITWGIGLLKPRYELSNRADKGANHD